MPLHFVVTLGHICFQVQTRAGSQYFVVVKYAR